MQFLDGENSLCEKVIASLLNLELTLTTFLGSGFTKTNPTGHNSAVKKSLK